MPRLDNGARRWRKRLREIRRAKTRLFLVTPPTPDKAFGEKLRAVLKTCDIASVLVWGEKSEGNEYLARAKDLVPLIQEYGAAALLRGDPQFVSRANADGFHSDTTSDDLKLAAAQFSGKGIFGAGNLKERHDAMVAGETNVDYVFFGSPRIETPLDVLLDYCEWWQSLFSIPCVAYAWRPEDAAALAAAGADFIAPGAALWESDDPAGVAGRLAID